MEDAPTPASQQDQALLLSATPAEAKSSEAVLDALRKTIDTIPALAWSARPDGSADFFNQQYLDFVGLSAEQAQDWGWTVAVHPDDPNGLAGSWQSVRYGFSGNAGESVAPGAGGRRANVATSGNMAEVQTAHIYLTGQSQCPVPTLSYAETHA